MGTLIRSLRFLYLLWGGVLISTLAINSRVPLPHFMGRWVWLLRFLFMPWGRGFLLGIGVAMSLAAMLEVWELIGLLLTDSHHNNKGPQ